MNHSSILGGAGLDRRQVRTRLLETKLHHYYYFEERSRQHKLDAARKFFADNPDIDSAQLEDTSQISRLGRIDSLDAIRVWLSVRFGRRDRRFLGLDRAFLGPGQVEYAK
jgi:hypothetical protein